MSEPSQRWREAQAFEAQYWLRPGVHEHEAQKQLLYAGHMGIRVANLCWKRILDVGGGPASLLLQCHNFGPSAVLDPLPMTCADKDRYTKHGIRLINGRAETEPASDTPYDEAWIYNVLQHTEQPVAVLANTQRLARIVRIFDWLDVPTDTGHIVSLREDMLACFFDLWRTGDLQGDLLVGRYFAGVWLS